MTNPFDTLRKKREEEEAKRDKLIEAQRLAKLKAEEKGARLHNFIMKLVEANSPMIETVLRHLVDAQYPNKKIKIPSEHQEWKPLWSIGYREEIPTDWSPKYVWTDIVKVSIVLDKKGNPIFLCEYENKKETCVISEPELIKALLNLHSRLF